MPSDLELKGARLLESTNGDINKAPPDVKIAADTLFNSLLSFSASAHKAKKSKDIESMNMWNSKIESLAESNPHLMPFFDSWRKMQEINEMNKALK